MGPVGDEFCCVLSPEVVSWRAALWICIDSRGVRAWCSAWELFMENPALQVKGNNSKTKPSSRVIVKGLFA